MSNRIIYVSRNCPHCKKLLIGIHKYEFLRPQFKIVDVGTQQYPDYIQSVPTLVLDQSMIKGEDVFGYMNHMVEKIFQKNPQLKEKYHPQQGQDKQPQQQQHHQQKQQQQQHLSKPGKGPSHDPVDDLVGWCPDGGCSFSPISESNDDCSKQLVDVADNMFATISEDNDQLAPAPQKVELGQDNSQYQKSSKQQQMDSSYERLMNERNLIK
jgi:hypothetical protein